MDVIANRTAGRNAYAILPTGLPWLLGAALLAVVSAHANVKSVMPDFYSEPGLHPFRDTVTYNEHIDPFSGNLNLSYVDLVIPGNGGLAIKIQRTYNSNNVYLSRKSPTNIAPYLTELMPRSTVGLGWTLHFGRVLRSGNVNPCDTNATNPNDDTLDNPILELPDGRQQIFFVNGTSFSALWITKEQWVAYCLTGNTGLLVISPEGVKYTMDYRRSGGSTYTTDLDYAWYTTRIEDRNGNYLAINYDATAAAPGKEAILSSITASDGRTVNFTYTDRTNAQLIRLTSIAANGQPWYYQYTPVADASGGHYYLTGVTRPDGLAWGYGYYARTSGTAGNRILRTVTHPYGGTVTYDYGYVCFMPISCTSAYDTFYSLVVSTKTNGGRDIAPGTWTYTYLPSTVEDVTTVTFPGGSHVYKHYGSKLVFGGSDIPGKRLWHLGLLKEKLIYNGSSLVHREIYSWDGLNRISYETYVRPPYDGSNPNISNYTDADVWAPVLVRKDIVQDSATYTTTCSNFDASYNPQTVAETGQASRTTYLSYFPRAANQNIVRLVKDEVIAGQATSKNTYRTYDTSGNLQQITRRGVTESFDYYSTGDLYTRTDARPVTWTYSDYYRGVPRFEQHPEGVTVRRAVNPTGTIASETNGRGKTTYYTYNGMNRPTSIQRPLGVQIGIGWTATGRTVTRGTYSQVTTFDGFGRPSYINTNGITQDVAYNALGFKSFESYPGSTSGTTYTTDVLGRVTGVAHPDTTSRAYTRLGNTVSIRNERNYTTTYTYRSFGDPDREEERALMRIDAPEGISTVFERDIIGLPHSVTQGGVTRDFDYDSGNFLITETNPETGVTTYGRDAVGNMRSRQVGVSPTTQYTYDGLNRLKFIDYPGTTPDVTYEYDGNNNVKVVDNGVSRRTIDYDDNDNLFAETLAVGTLTLNAAYGYNTLDQLTSITYPSLRQVSYAPDAVGRPTTVTPYVPTVSHYPNGVPQSLAYANGQTATLGLSNRQWISSISTQKTGVGYAMDLGYGYDGVGNVSSVTNTLDSSDSKTMSYDGVDRLTVAGVATASYDTADNITSLRTSAGTLTYAYSPTNRLSSVSGYKSYSFSYDVYGNVIGNGRNSFVYDDASNLRSVTGATTATYDYDGKGMRVRAEKNGQTTYYFYGLSGNLLGEYDPTGMWKKEYAYLGKKLVAAVENVPGAPGIPPSITVPTSSSTGIYTISWGAASGAPTTYELQEGTEPSFSCYMPPCPPGRYCIQVCRTPPTIYSGADLSVVIGGGRFPKSNGPYYSRTTIEFERATAADAATTVRAPTVSP